MLQLFIGTTLVIAVLFGSEYLSRKKIISGELSRKSTHITMGLVFAIMPFFVGLRFVALLAFADIFLAVLARKMNLFSQLRTVGRQTWGDFFFLLGVSGAALLTESKWVFAASILIMGLADAAAALVGTARGHNRYHVFGNTKSFEGSSTFLFFSLLILSALVYIAPSGIALTLPSILGLAVATTLVEAIAPWGLDNLLLPVFVTLVINSLI